MTRTDDYAFHDPPPHPVFEALEVNGEIVEDWRIMLQKRDTHFPGEAGGRVRRAYRYTQYGVDQHRYTFSFRQVVLDDAIGEYIALIEWLAPYSDTEGLVGYFRSDYDDHPILLYFKKGQVYMSKITQTPQEIATGAPWPTDG